MTLQPESRRLRDAYDLATWQWFPLPPTDVFPFFADAFNLERITPDILHFQVLTAGPIEMRTGARIDYRLRLHGVPIRWRTTIAEWDPPRRFVDHQLSGPYREWHHTHTFEAHAGGTMVRDAVRYRLYGPALVTRLVNAWLVGPDTTRIFAYRHGALERAFGLEGQTRSGPVTLRRTRD